MANHIKVNDKTINVGDLVKIDYRFKEGEKLKEQIFRGILIAIKGSSKNRMITVRKISRSGIGVERIFSMNSPFLANISVVKKGNARKAKLYYIRKKSESEIRQRLYQ